MSTEEEEHKEDKIEILTDDYPKFDLSFKIIVLGNSGVGKSCLSMKASRNTFENNYLATVGFEFYAFNIKLNDVVIKLQIWDTCGQEIYRSLIKNFYRNSSLAVLVYAIDDRASFDSIDAWIKELKSNSNPDIKIFLIGNKADLEESREVATEDGSKFTNDYHLNLFMEASAKTGLNAQKIFIEAAKVLYQDYTKYNKNVEKETDIKIQSLVKDTPNPTKKKTCC